jgi:hypothetical protein
METIKLTLFILLSILILSFFVTKLIKIDLPSIIFIISKYLLLALLLLITISFGEPLVIIGLGLISLGVIYLDLRK